MSTDHTAEQLEAAHRDNNQNAAVRMILRHLTAHKCIPTMNACIHLARTYWANPAAGIAAIVSFTAN